MAYNGPKATSTMIRTIYSNGVSYLTIRFYNNNLSLSITPFVGKDQNGKNKYDNEKSVSTVGVNYELASSFNKLISDALDGKYNDDVIQIIFDLWDQSKLIFERKRDQNNKLCYWLIIDKNGLVGQFKFESTNVGCVINGQPSQQVIESGLSHFNNILTGYLIGINADRHLDKLTEEYVKSKETSDQNNTYQNNNYQRKNNYSNKGYQNKNNYNQAPPVWTPPSQSVGMSNYQVPNQ